MNSSIQISLAQESELYDALILEQEEWNDNINHFTTMDLIDQVEDSLYETVYSNYECGVEDGTFVTALFVYPYDTNLAYNLKVTWGDLSDSSISEIIVKESINFSITRELELKYPVRSIVSYNWYAGVWDGEGNPLVEPNISFDGQKVITDQDVYGSLRVVYKTERHTYRVEIQAREDVVENFFTSVAYAWWDGGITMLEIESPVNAEDDYFKGLTCRNRSIVSTTKDDPDWQPPTADSEDETINIDYCTQGVV